MSNSTSVALLAPRPLRSSDAAALRADIVPRAFWEPSFLLERDFSDDIAGSATGLTTTDDVWEIVLSPPSDMPNYIFYLIAMRAVVHSGGGVAADFDAFFDTAAGFSIGPEVAADFAWDAVDMSSMRSIIGGNFKAVNPIFHGFPATPVSARTGAVGTNALGGFAFTVGTFNAAALAALVVNIDARWLAFPEAVVRSAGFYNPRMFFKVG